MNSGIYSGTVRHRRYLPREHGFSYPFFMYFLDLAQIDGLPDLAPWFSTRSWSLARFRRDDYLGETENDLDQAVRKRMELLTGEQVCGKVFGLLNMRTLGLYFSPVNFYFGFDQKARCSHFLAEVSNIPWNKRHHYAYFLEPGEQWVKKQEKEFHVSPFNPMNQRYGWHIAAPDKTLALGIDVDDQRGRVFEARLELEKLPLDRPTLRRLVLRKPVMTASVVAGIYFQALKLYLKGVPYIPPPKEAT